MKKEALHFHIVTLFPEAFSSYLQESIIKRAIENGRIKVSFYNPRDFADNKWDRVDGRPYGGGPGMVIEASPVLKAASKALSRKRGSTPIIFLSPGGKQFTTKDAEALAKKRDILFIAGRYEGIDARAPRILKARHVSIGPFILTGGELPALIIMDAVARHVPGVLGNQDSIEESRVSSHEVYTRPETFLWKGKKYKVPKVLLSGHHADIEEWKKRKG